MDQAVTISRCYSWREKASVLRIFTKHEQESDRAITILKKHSKIYFIGYIYLICYLFHAIFYCAK